MHPGFCHPIEYLSNIFYALFGLHTGHNFLHGREVDQRRGVRQIGRLLHPAHSSC
jgi:hypothetical protein